MDTRQALQVAQNRRLDLVEVSPKTVPPVCKFIDYGKYRYEVLKKTQKQRLKNRPSRLKCIRLSMRISEHDLGVKVAQGTNFLERGDKIKVDILLRGRENLHADIAFETLRKYTQMFKIPVTLEQEPKKVGSSVNMIVRKK